MELKNKIIEIKNSLETLTGRFEQAEEIITKSKTEQWKLLSLRNREEKSEEKQSPRTCGSIKWTQIRITGFWKCELISFDLFPDYFGYLRFLELLYNLGGGFSYLYLKISLDF